MQIFGEFVCNEVSFCDGLFLPGGMFYCMDPVDLRALEELFREHVLGFLVKKEKLDPVFAQKLRAWRYSGFGIHNGKVIAKDERADLERVVQYIARNSFSESKMTYNEETGAVLYRSKANYNTKRNFEVFQAEDFIAAIRQLVNFKVHIIMSFCIYPCYLRYLWS